MQGGRFKALAIASGERLKDLPNVPTLSKPGADLKVSFCSDLLAPAGTPAPVIKRLHEEVARVMDMPDVRKRFGAMSVVPPAAHWKNSRESSPLKFRSGSSWPSTTTLKSIDSEHS